jgi:hypothetical protein
MHSSNLILSVTFSLDKDVWTPIHSSDFKVLFLGAMYVLMDLIDFWCFNATFSNISAISWRPVLVVEEAGENHRPWASN